MFVLSKTSHDSDVQACRAAWAGTSSLVLLRSFFQLDMVKPRVEAGTQYIAEITGSQRNQWTGTVQWQRSKTNWNENDELEKAGFSRKKKKTRSLSRTSPAVFWSHILTELSWEEVATLAVPPQQTGRNTQQAVVWRWPLYSTTLQPGCRRSHSWQQRHSSSNCTQTPQISQDFLYKQGKNIYGDSFFYKLHKAPKKL